MFLDVGFTRESSLHKSEMKKLHEALLELYRDYVYDGEYCTTTQFFEALMNSDLKVQDLLTPLERDKKRILDDPILEDVFSEFEEGLKNRLKSKETSNLSHSTKFLRQVFSSL